MESTVKRLNFKNNVTHWAILLGNAEIRVLGYGIKEGMPNLDASKGTVAKLEQLCKEYFPHSKNKKECRICKDNVTHPKVDDGLCSKCWNNIGLKYYGYSKYEKYGEKLHLKEAAKQSSLNINIESLTKIIEKKCKQENDDFKVRKTSGLQTLGTCRFGRWGMLTGITYSHLTPPKQQISTLLHEFTHAYSHMHLSAKERNDELLTQKIEGYLYNYFLYSEDEVNNYSFWYLENKFKDNIDEMIAYRDKESREIAYNLINIIENGAI